MSKKWAQQQIADAAEFVHEGVMARVDRRFPSQDALISAHNENAIDLRCELSAALTQIAALTKQVEELQEEVAGRKEQVGDLVDAVFDSDDEVESLKAELATAKEELAARTSAGNSAPYVPKAQYDAKVAKLEAELAALREVHTQEIEIMHDALDLMNQYNGRTRSECIRIAREHILDTTGEQA